MTKQPARIQVKETERYWGDFEGSFESIISIELIKLGNYLLVNSTLC